MTIGLLLLPCCNRPARAKNCSAVIVITRGLDFTEPEANLNLFTGGCWIPLVLATIGATLLVCFNAILPASKTTTNDKNVTISYIFFVTMTNLFLLIYAHNINDKCEDNKRIAKLR